MSLAIERFEVADATPVAELWYSAWRSTGARDDRVSPESLERRLLEENWSIHILRERDEVIGFMALECGEPILSQLFIAPARQGGGHGTHLLALAKQRLADGFTLRCDAANERARRFYERH